MLLSLWLIARKVATYQDYLSANIQSHPRYWLWILGFSLLHVINLNFLGLGWHDNLLHLQQKITCRQILHIYGLSQIGKYLPSNLMHFAARQWLAQRWNLQQTKVLQATVNEILGHLCSISICLLLFALYNSDRIVERLNPYLFVMKWLLLLPALIFVLFTFSKVRKVFWKYFSPLLYGFSISSLGYYLTFHMIGSVMFVWLLQLLSPVTFSVSWVMLAYAFAWLVGFVVPGAPGGLGVREVLLMVLLAGMLPESVILLAAIANRLLTTLGDFWFFIEGLALKHYSSNAERSI